MPEVQGPSLKITSNITDVKSDLQALDRHVTRTMDRAQMNTSQSMDKAAKSTLSSFSTISIAFTALFGHTLVNQVFETVNAFQALSNVFNTFSNNAIESADQMNFLIEESQRLGFSIVELSDAYKKFFVAGKIAGFETERLQQTFTGVAEAAAVAGLTSQQLEGAFRALHQMMSKGKVQAEELRGQLGEHLPGAFEIAAKALGVTTKELDKMLSKGEVTAKALLENFPEELRKAYGPGLAGALGLPRRELERLKNAITLNIKEMNDGINFLFSSVLRVVSNTISITNQDTLNALNAWFTEASVYIENIPLIAEKSVESFTRTIQPVLDAYSSIGKRIYDGFVKFSSNSVIADWIADWITAISLVPLTAQRVGIVLGSIFFEWQLFASKTFDGIYQTAVNYFAGVIGYLMTAKDEVDLIFHRIALSVVQTFDDTFKSIGNRLRGLSKIAKFFGFDETRREINEVAMQVTGVMSDSVKKYQRDVKEASDEANNSYYAYMVTVARNENNVRDIREAADKARIASGKIIEQQQNQLKQDIFKELDLRKAANDEIKEALEKTRNQREVVKDLQNSYNGVEKELKEVTVLTEEWQKEVDKIEKKIADDLTDSILEFVETGKFAFKDLVNSMLKEIARIAIQKQITQPFAEAASGLLGDFFKDAFNGASTTTTTTASVTPSAKGNAFVGGNIVPFAKGGIIDSPTFFGFGNGRLGVGGEAGTEAIMPIKRGPTGNLGIEASGASPVIVNVYNESGSNATVKESNQGGKRRVDVIIEDAVKSALSSGRLDRTMSSSFGLKRKGVA